MLRILCSTFAAAAFVTAAGVAHASYSNLGSESLLSPTTVATDSVISIGATTSMNEHDAIVSAPTKGKIVATANADVFCEGEETARSLVIDVEQTRDVTIDFCEAHLERRDVVIRFVATP